MEVDLTQTVAATDARSRRNENDIADLQEICNTLMGAVATMQQALLKIGSERWTMRHEIEQMKKGIYKVKHAENPEF